VILLVSALAIAGSDDFVNSREWNKVSPTIQQMWKEAGKTGDFSQKIECFVVVQSSGSDGDQDILFGAGYATQVFTGNVARGHMQLKNLPRVAQLPFVRVINLAKKP